MRIYLSGKITGTDDYMERFAAAELKLKAKYPNDGVIDPAAICALLPTPMSHDEYMSVCIQLIKLCDAIYIINPDDVKKSKGVHDECIYALSHKMQIIYGDGEDS